MAQIFNQATALGDFGAETDVSIASTIAVVEASNDITFTKTADQTVWYGGTLTYSMVITNSSATDSYTTPVVTDVLDPAITFVEGSVVFTTDNGATYSFDDGTNTLTFNLSTIAPSGTVTIEYQVIQA